MLTGRQGVRLTNSERRFSLTGLSRLRERSVLRFFLNLTKTYVHSIISGQCLTHSGCSSGEKCVLTAVADRSGRFTQTCVQDQPNNDKVYKGSLDSVPEVIETEPIDKPDTNQRPQSKNFQWFSTFSSQDKKLYINVNKQLK